MTTLWTNGREETPLPSRRAPSPSRTPTDVLVETAKPLFAIDADPSFAEGLALPVVPEAPKTKRGQRSRKRAPRSSRGRVA